jgi:hypothetical protein
MVPIFGVLVKEIDGPLKFGDQYFLFLGSVIPGSFGPKPVYPINYKGDESKTPTL